jgi:phosphoribosyl 1,2-cyclic phosphodiesterase
MRFCSLGSGSDGNALLISSGTGVNASHLMLDCGFGLKEAGRRLSRHGVEPHQLSGIVVTHEHSDHISGVFKLARHCSVPVWLTHGTFDGAARDEMIGVDIRICRDSEPFAIGDLELTPYTVPHDAREPVQYLASDGHRKLGVLTDVGHSTPHLLAALGGCDALLLEFNHDSEMLARSAYPAWLKARIAGPLGHLSNAAAAEILDALDKRRLRTLVAAHLSQKNNTGQLALESIAGVIGREGIDVVVAEQEHGFDWIPC